MTDESHRGNGPLEGLTRELGAALGRLGLPPEQIEAAVREGLRPAVERLDLVSREELEAVRDELARTQQRLTTLEARLAALEDNGNAAADGPEVAPD